MVFDESSRSFVMTDSHSQPILVSCILLGPMIRFLLETETSFCRVERGRRLKLTTLPPYVIGFSRKCGILNISQPYSPPRPATAITLLYFTLLFHALYSFVLYPPECFYKYFFPDPTNSSSSLG
jgi:hypothetical protein